MLLHAAWPLVKTAVALCRPALHIYSWVHTALRGLVTRQQTLDASLHEFIQAYKQKNMAEVSPVASQLNAIEHDIHPMCSCRL